MHIGVFAEAEMEADLKVEMQLFFRFLNLLSAIVTTFQRLFALVP